MSCGSFGTGILVLNTINFTPASFAASPISFAPWTMGPDWLKEVDGRLRKITSAPSMAFEIGGEHLYLFALNFEWFGAAADGDDIVACFCKDGDLVSALYARCAKHDYSHD
jgi:hypothetical protein